LGVVSSPLDITDFGNGKEGGLVSCGTVRRGCL